MRKLRIAANLSQEELTARCQTAGWEISRGTFAKLEAGLRRVNDGEVVLLAKALRCTVSDLLDGFPSGAVSVVVRHGDTPE